MTPKESKSGFFKGVRSEWKKIVWPTKKEVGNYLIVVIIISLVLGAFIYGLDSLFKFLLSLIV